ncbi:hypothetical protein SPI_04448 [Niveomyces insectorum RCEF 264]|uniref:Uncharacterized protein n=1 Tax=Niveomyces insectorum RCEF 264 TaxID=1081102 RepID=A0A167VRH9_9HYPO|nr:hypothetical protein SPI_04448 [Niveomyces insectorum RCEF 264]
MPHCGTCGVAAGSATVPGHYHQAQANRNAASGSGRPTDHTTLSGTKNSPIVLSPAKPSSFPATGFESPQNASPERVRGSIIAKKTAKEELVLSETPSSSVIEDSKTGAKDAEEKARRRRRREKQKRRQIKKEDEKEEEEEEEEEEAEECQSKKASKPRKSKEEKEEAIKRKKKKARARLNNETKAVANEEPNGVPSGAGDDGAGAPPLAPAAETTHTLKLFMECQKRGFCPKWLKPQTVGNNLVQRLNINGNRIYSDSGIADREAQFEELAKRGLEIVCDMPIPSHKSPTKRVANRTDVNTEVNAQEASEAATQVATANVAGTTSASTTTAEAQAYGNANNAPLPKDESTATAEDAQTPNCLVPQADSQNPGLPHNLLEAVQYIERLAGDQECADYVRFVASTAEQQTAHAFLTGFTTAARLWAAAGNNSNNVPPPPPSPPLFSSPSLMCTPIADTVPERNGRRWRPHSPAQRRTWGFMGRNGPHRRQFPARQEPSDAE